MEEKWGVGGGERKKWSKERGACNKERKNRQERW
jgi:hypothetical protein